MVIYVDTVYFDDSTTSIADREPSVPAKDGYIGYWYSYELEPNDIDIYPCYVSMRSNDEQTVYFDEYGHVLQVLITVSGALTSDEPNVPYKEGYTGYWYKERLDNSNIIGAYPMYEKAPAESFVLGDG